MDEQNAEPASAGPRSEAIAELLEGTLYRVVRRIGSGGMGLVVEAEHRQLGKRFVVKILHEELACQVSALDRMRLEAQTSAALAGHRHIVQVYDFGETRSARPFFVMELLGGHTFRDETRKRGAIPPLEAIDFALQMLDGLAAAHRVGLVHRDLKPGNVFVCEPEAGKRVVKVLDFGLVKVLDGFDGSPAPLAIPTRDGTAMGTPRYMAPEQVLGQRVDERTDVYGAGGVLYALLTGHGPFRGINDVIELSQAQLTKTPPPPSEVVGAGALPPELDRAVLRALAKKPADRFPSVKAFADELAEIARALEGAHPDAAPPPTTASADDAQPLPARVAPVVALVSALVFAALAAVVVLLVAGRL